MSTLEEQQYTTEMEQTRQDLERDARRFFELTKEGDRKDLQEQAAQLEHTFQRWLFITDGGENQ